MAEKPDEEATEPKLNSKEGKMSKKVQITDVEMTTKLAELEKQTEYVVGGETTIEDEVIAAIAGMAAQQVEGVASLASTSMRRSIARAFGAEEKRAKGVKVEAGKKEVIIDLKLVVIYGFSIPNVIIEVRKKVAHQLLEMVGLIAKEINVDVASIEFPERMPGKVE